VKFERFSLYAQRPDVDLQVRPGVFCLAGANGIGKSTFLAAVNFALTGRVPTPDRAFSSTSEYYENSARFAGTFFDGRIDEEDRATAAITIEILVGDLAFTVTRGLFEPDALRALRIAGAGRDQGTAVLDGDGMSESQRHEEYKRRLAEAIGLQSFDQFVFLQHFVLTFDESRNLLFWNSKALEAALFLAFDADPKQQTLAEGYRREMERAESRGRNYRFHAIRVRGRVDAIKAVLGETGPPSRDAARLEAEYAALLAARDAALEVVAEAEATTTDADVAFANASAALITLRGEYAQAFSRHIGDRSVTAQHPLVLEATEERRCPVCGTEGDAVAKTVSAKVGRNMCPFCDTPLQARGNRDELETLRELDRKMTEARMELETAGAKRDRLTGALTEARQHAGATAAAVRNFETEHADAAKRVQGRAGAQAGSQEELARLQHEVDTLLQESKRAYDDRDTWKRKLQGIQKKLELQYRSAEENFVPVFRELAGQFLGIDLDIVVEPLGTTGMALVLELRQTKRRRQHQLSESQRFFLDIALRMALARFISDQTSRAALFIDTPEGSLDIAYESRAGGMFAQFALSGHDILMTANINTSALLRKLASMCGEAHMTLVRMTEWTDLSSVQLEESALFEQAYAEIDKELHGHAG